MKAIAFNKYGSPNVLHLKEVDKPVPKEDQVLVKIHATAINDYDWSMVRGKPFLYRLMFGITKPNRQIPGMELAGMVEALGPVAKRFKIGDAVYGDISDHGFGSFAEYICISEKSLVLKPEKMTFEEATSIPHASMLAYQGLVEIGKIKNGQKILINGAGGGMGTFALQIAKTYTIEVTGVDSGNKLEMIKSIGFDHVIDYKKEDFTRNKEKYDLILDAKTNRSPSAYKRALSPDGKYVTVGGHLSRLMQLFLAIKLGQKHLHILSLKPNKDITHIQQLYEEGKIKPIIDGPYPLSEVPKRLQYFGEGKHQGKVVIAVV